MLTYDECSKDDSAYIFLISKLCICMQLIMSGKRFTISLLLMVIFATIFFRAIFLLEWFLSFLLPPFNSVRNSATLPCDGAYQRLAIMRDNVQVRFQGQPQYISPVQSSMEDMAWQVPRGYDSNHLRTIWCHQYEYDMIVGYDASMLHLFASVL
jgi:hypothetical protein